MTAGLMCLSRWIEHFHKLISRVRCEAYAFASQSVYGKETLLQLPDNRSAVFGGWPDAAPGLDDFCL